MSVWIRCSAEFCESPRFRRSVRFGAISVRWLKLIQGTDWIEWRGSGQGVGAVPVKVSVHSHRHRYDHGHGLWPHRRGPDASAPAAAIAPDPFESGQQGPKPLAHARLAPKQQLVET